LNIRIVGIVVLSAVAGFLLFAFAIGILPIRDLSARPAVAYETSEDLAAALNAGGVECDLEDQEPGRKVDPGFCRDPEATAGVGLFLRIFDNDETHDSFVRDHVRCGYEEAVVGERWMITVDSKAEAEAVLEAVGGRLIEGGAC
jgi:hypothetical protein